MNGYFAKLLISRTTPFPTPNISSSPDVVVAVWNPDATAIDASSFSLTKYDGSMKAAEQSIVDISFNSTEYLDPRNATLTVVNPDANTSGGRNGSLKCRSIDRVAQTLLGQPHPKRRIA